MVRRPTCPAAAILLLCAAALTGCAAHTRSLERPVRGTDPVGWYQDAELQAVLDRATASQQLDGNEARLLVNGAESFPARYENLASASMVLVKTFILTDDDEGRRMAEALAERARAGIPVVLQVDVKGSVGAATDVADMLQNRTDALPVGEKPIIAELRGAGVLIVPTNDPGRPWSGAEWVANTKRLLRDPKAAVARSVESLSILDHCDHEKMFVTLHGDGEVRAILGGLNLASEYALGGVPGARDSVSGRPGWRDTDVEVRGPAAARVVDDFVADYERHVGEPFPVSLRARIDQLLSPGPTAAGTARVRLVTNHPLAERTLFTEDAYRVLLQATPAGEPIFLATPYFAPSKVLRDAIIEHARLGGHVTILSNSPDSSDIAILTDAARFAARAILEETDNVTFLEWRGDADAGELTLHEKVATFGLHGPVVIGSFNLDAQSSVHNTEAIFIIDDPALRAAVAAMMIRDLTDSKVRAVPLAALRSASVDAQIRFFLTHELAWYWL